jgi:Fe2+ transport system protein B
MGEAVVSKNTDELVADALYLLHDLSVIISVIDPSCLRILYLVKTAILQFERGCQV